MVLLRQMQSNSFRYTASLIQVGGYGICVMVVFQTFTARDLSKEPQVFNDKRFLGNTKQYFDLDANELKLKQNFLLNLIQTPNSYYAIENFQFITYYLNYVITILVI